MKGAKMKKKVKNKATKFSNPEFYFDDCPVCQAMKQAKEKGRDLTMTELKQEFLKAKEKGAIVGETLTEGTEVH